VIRASTLFSRQEHEAIEAAVTEAERETSGEIVPVVATVSGRYDRAEDLFGLLLGLVALAIAWLAFQGSVETPWSGVHAPSLGLLASVLIVLAGFIAGAALATRFPVLRLPFIPRAEMREEVERRALEAFQRNRIRTTAGGTGILIYVSLYERMVRVVGDDAIAARLSQSHWEAICDLVVHGMKNGRAAEGLAQAIRKGGELLADHFPIQADDVNELPNELVLLD